MGNRHVNSDENKVMFYLDATNLCCQSRSQTLPYDEIEMWHGLPDLYMKKLEKVLITSHDSHVGYFFEVVLRYPNNRKKTMIFPFCPENKIIPIDKYND